MTKKITIPSNVFIIDGSEARPPKAFAKLTPLLADAAKDIFAGSNVVITKVSEGYDIDTERQKFTEADLVLFHFPVYWFSTPASLKKYIDDVYEAPMMYVRADHYGRGGVLRDTSYMFTTSWNAQAAYFHDKDSIVGDKTLDQILLPLHMTQEFVGMKQLPTFAAYDVVNHPDIDTYIRTFRSHLGALFQDSTDQKEVK